MDTGAQAPLIIYTDASFCHVTRKASWGAVIRQADTEQQLSGQFGGTCNSSEQAELQAIAKVLHLLNARRQLNRGHRVRVFMDNRACFHALTGWGGFKRNREAMEAAMRVIRSVESALALQLTWHWIAGHQRAGNTIHGDANRVADALARRAHPSIPSLTERRKASKARRKARARADAPARERAREEAGRDFAQSIIELAAAQRAQPEGAAQ